jgi:hypothetical protein
MSSIERIWLKISRVDDTSWEVTILKEDGTPLEAVPRTMRRKNDLPLPPEDDLPGADEPHTTLCTPDGVDGVRLHQERIGSRVLQKEDNDIEIYGRYLFACLIGSCWSNIEQSVGAGKLIDLAICIADDDDPLHTLHWEMMHGPDGFLGKGTPRHVSISRVVESQKVVEKASSPPQVLFVIYRNLTDRKLRAGAEVVGLLRNIQQDIQVDGHFIHSRILQRASPEKIRKSIEIFKPDVIHFICHGGIDPNTGPYLKLQKDEDDQSEERSAQQIVSLLEAGGRLPGIVIISACYSAAYQESEGEPMRPEDTSPLAVQLVKSGVPIVVGMSGRVSDLACRLFTRCFGEAIVAGKPLVAAAEKARQAAFSEGQSPKESVDWAYPTLFLAEKVPPDFTPFDTSSVDAYANVEKKFCKQYEITSKPVFCGRDDIFEAYYKLFEEDGPGALAVADEKKPMPELQIGRTRLLQTFAIQAMRDGHIPLLLSGPERNWTPPKSIKQFASSLHDAIRKTRATFGLERKHTTLLRKLISSDDLVEFASDPETDVHVQHYIHDTDTTELTIGLVRAVLCADIEKTRDDIIDKHPRFGKARIIVLLDDLHEYNEALAPLLNEGLTANGLGDPEADRYEDVVPVVMIMGMISPVSETMRKFLEESPPWLRTVDLEPFKEDEVILAYERVILYPYKPNLLPPYSDKAWIRNRDADANELESCWYQRLRVHLDHLPSDFNNPLFYSFVMAASDLNLLVPATDQDLLEDLRDQV